MAQLYHCITGCDICQKAVKAGTSFLGDELYTCASNPKKHKEISARDCHAFTCANIGKYSICVTCKKSGKSGL